MKDAEDYCPCDKNDWRKWLELNHNKKEGVWLVFYKKKSPNYNLSWSESVDEALCFGWIDSTKRTIDSTKYKQYFTKRKAKSNWSKINKDKVKTLIDQGLMEEAGYKSIEIAKENGSWTILDEVEVLVMPEDLKAEFANYKGLMEYFDSLSKSVKKILLYRIVSAKRKETRQRRILEIVENVSKNRINIIICSITIALAACTGQVPSKKNSKEIIADRLSNKDISQTAMAKASSNDLAKIYSQAISDYITEVSKQDLMVLDTLYLGKRDNGQPDDFPNIVLPETINNIKIRLIEPEVGKKLQEEKKSSVYINLIGWVDKDKAEFIFVTFSNGFEHQFDYHISYKYDSDRMEFDLAESRIEIFSKK